MRQNRNHPLMRTLMLLRNKLGQGTKLEEGYISNPDWMCVAIYLSPEMTIKEAEELGMEWRQTSLAPVLNSNDRCHALNYEGTKTWGKEPNKRTETPLYFYPSGKNGRAKTFSLTRLGEKRAKELEKLLPKANVDYVREPGQHEKIYIPGWELSVNALQTDVWVMSHFQTNSWGGEVHYSTDDGRHSKKPHGARLEKLKHGETVTVLHNIHNEVLHVRTARGKEGFIEVNDVHHPDEDQDDLV